MLSMRLRNVHTFCSLTGVARLLRAGAVLFILQGQPQAVVSGCTASTPESESFCRQALSLPSLGSLNPLLHQACLEKSFNAQSFESARLRTTSISAGYTPRELERWHIDALENEEAQNQLRQRHPSQMVVAESAVLSATREIDMLTSLSALWKRLGRSEHELKEVLSSLEPDFPPWWFIAEVRSPYRYLLGHESIGLALDTIEFLKELQETGEVRNAHGQAIASLRDLTGKSYPYLVVEYVLHEALEQTDLTHDEIIALTTEALGYGFYLPAHLLCRVQPWMQGRRIFTRPGQTALGQALRQFITWRFKQRAARLTGRQIRVSYFDPSYRSVRAIQGAVYALIGEKNSQPMLGIADGLQRVELAFNQIVRIEEIPSVTPATFDEALAVSLEQVMQRLQAGFPVTLAEAQLRALAGPWSPEEFGIPHVLEGVRFLRDAEGRRLSSGGRLTATGVANVLAWARDVASTLNINGLRLIVDDITFNVPGVDGTPCMDWPLSGARLFYARDHGDNRRECAEHLLNAILAFSHVTLEPSASPRLSTGARTPKSGAPRFSNRLSQSG
jgi:hypothetical protein